MSQLKSTRREPLNASQKRQAANRAAAYMHPFPAVQNPLLPFSLVAYLSHFITVRQFHHLLEPLIATYNTESGTVWVTDEHSVRTLWTRGFFGKGSLSRSEPSWWIREQNRRGYGLSLTSEEITAIRRLERKEFKQIKAQERLTAAQAGVAPRLNADLALPSKLDKLSKSTAQGLPWDHKDNSEHLQLDPVDAFYLIYALGALHLQVSDSLPHFTAKQAFRTFMSSPVPARDDDFLIRYVAYHHFRSLGWVVRTGIKFCTDFILYKGTNGTPQSTRGSGPVGGHAEFSVIIVKRFADNEDVLKRGQEECLLDGKGEMTWKWLSTVNRATSGVKKTLIFAYVTIPSQIDCDTETLQDPACISLYNVREVVVRRFLPARLRD